VIPAGPGWLVTAGGCLCMAVLDVTVWLWRQRFRLAVRRSPEPPRTVLEARLIPSPREIAGRPSAASTARPVHVITDLPGPQGARGSGRRS